ncbi:TetR/AcrR family transcriptional regulator [Oceanimonas baumannii]|uniref:TetR family transcriptional regulator n=1 Tax=Oceanimonas baumannii TaxID=129578 RepID=A0A235CI60_9GAMM|nr:TetR/AcrR family transcriptional regulator [Oceanimonas baumannii]MCC4263422.1 TetR/AcrR family transcriptional regulator [Oceanimonas baumannii]OYD24298.1 TetR family transcriptional regulator [Oceanimonas baumannii]TDW59030.1 TetR family transcriptional regulator [Oceanimonas baumannii]
MTNKRERILNAAEHLIAHKGFQGMSMQQVAKEAEVAAGTIYRYFKDKESLLRCVHEERLQEVSLALLEGVDTQNPCFEQFRVLWQNCLHYLLSNADCLLYRVQYEASPLFTREEEKCMDERYFKPVFEFFERGRETGLFRDLPSDLLGFLAMESLMLLTQRHTRGCIQLNDAILDELMDAAWNSILKR